MLDMRKPELHAQMAASNLQNTFHTGIDHFLSPKLPIDIPIQSEDGESNDIRSPLLYESRKAPAQKAEQPPKSGASFLQVCFADASGVRPECEGFF